MHCVVIVWCSTFACTPPGKVEAFQKICLLVFGVGRLVFQMFKNKFPNLVEMRARWSGDEGEVEMI